MKPNRNEQPHNQDSKAVAEKKQQKQPKNNVTSTGVKKLAYDKDGLNTFIATVFHATFEEGEHVIAFASKSKIPSFPKEATKLISDVSNAGIAKVCYYGTSTVGENPEDGKLYNRKQLFKSLRVVVLDDIGTKIQKESLPKELAPNYIIESSAGNYQYGFILDTPIYDLELAEALIHLVYTSGFSDKGGKMATKAVRLPCGINGKEGAGQNFEVKLHELNDDYWSPSDLLDVLDVGVSWEDVKKDVNVAKQGDSARFAGTSLWSPIKPTSASLDGVVDPVLEYLYENDLVLQDNGEWVTIQCPWHKEHSKGGDNLAGYSPVGRGGKYSNSRGFHCFHGHCEDRKGQAFLQWVAIEAGIYAPVIDNVADLVADYAYVAAEDSAYRIRGISKPTGMKLNSFKNVHTKKVAVYDNKGKEKMIAESALWLTSPNRLIVQGLLADPSCPERIVEHDGLKYLNTYAPPPWGKGDYATGDVETFKEFIEYLVPDEDQRHYFTQWLAAKAQDPTFKGAAVLMVAQTQGTGRTTLTDMVRELFTPNNVSKVTFPQLCAATDANAFNDWLESGIVTCDEIMSNQHNKHKVYESLKDLFDPRPKHMVLNQKYGNQRSTTVYTSYLLMTNHISAIGELGGDRRIYVIRNPLIPAEDEYFVSINKWLAQGTWARNVWRWLNTIEVDLPMLLAPAPRTEVKDVMIESTRSVADRLADSIIKYSDGVVLNSVEELARSVLEYKLVTNAEALAYHVANKLKEQSQASNVRMRADGKQIRVRLHNEALKELGIKSVASEKSKDVIDLECKQRSKIFIDKLTEDESKVIADLSDMIDSY
jgi:hypothetical protein